MQINKYNNFFNMLDFVINDIKMKNNHYGACPYSKFSNILYKINIIELETCANYMIYANKHKVLSTKLNDNNYDRLCITVNKDTLNSVLKSDYITSVYKKEIEGNIRNINFEEIFPLLEELAKKISYNIAKELIPLALKQEMQTKITGVTLGITSQYVNGILDNHNIII